MTKSEWLVVSFYLLLMFDETISRESPLECWRCEVTVQSLDTRGEFVDDCRAQFDFTQHTREECDGKCWKLADLVDTKRFENNTGDGLLLKHGDLSKFKSSRRCFSANELVRAAEMGVNTSDGCRQVRKDGRKMKEVCFCSDQDMCNNALKLTKHFFILFSSVFLVYWNKSYHSYQ